MINSNIWTILVPVLTGIAGYLITYFNTKRIERNRNRLERINRQLDNFYGPILAIVQANEMAWRSFTSHFLNGEKFYKKDNNPTRKELLIFYHWMDTVFMPNNEKLYKIIVEETSLLEDNEIPPPFLKLLAHYLEYKLYLDQMKESRKIEAVVVDTSYPGKELLCYCSASFAKLKAKQSKLV